MSHSIIAWSMSSLVCEITKKITKMMHTTDIKYPEFLNTQKKYDECVQNTKTVKQFEDVCLKLLSDDSTTMIDVMKIMAKMEEDIIHIHGNKDVSCILDMAEAIIGYHLVSSKEKAQEILATQKKQQKEEEVTCDCELGAELLGAEPVEPKPVEPKPVKPKRGKFVCDCGRSQKIRRRSH